MQRRISIIIEVNYFMLSMGTGTVILFVVGGVNEDELEICSCFGIAAVVSVALALIAGDVVRLPSVLIRSYPDFYPLGMLASVVPSIINRN
jgi:hypothetical protein